MVDVGRSAVRKAGWRLVPLIGLGYGAAYMDRVNISFASVSMNKELGFSASMYGFGAGIFFLSYALCEVPSNLLLVRFGARRWLARIMLTWGLLAMGMMLVRTAHAFYAMRFFLGVAEAGFFPGVVYYLTEWFPPEWRARMISRFYIALPLSSTVMGSMAGWLLGLNGRLGLRGWQWLFLVEGLPPLVLSGLFYWLLPDTPAEARWLTADERAWLVGRLGEAQGEDAAGGDVWGDLRTALGDRRVLGLGAFFLCILTVLYGWAFSAPVILQGLTGWTIGQVGWLIAGMGAAGGGSDARGGAELGPDGGAVLACDRAMRGDGRGVCGGRRDDGGVGGGARVCADGNAVQTRRKDRCWRYRRCSCRGRASAVGYAAITAIGVGGGFAGPYWMGRAKDRTGDYRWGLMALAVPSLLAAGIAWGLKRWGERLV